MAASRSHRGVKNSHAGRGGNNISLHPLTPEEAITAMFQIDQQDVKRIASKRSGTNRKKKK